MKELFIYKHTPKKLIDLPYKKEFNNFINNIIENDLLNIILIDTDLYAKNILLNVILSRVNVDKNDLLFLSKIKDHGITNLRNEFKKFSKTPSLTNKKKFLILDELQLYNDNIQRTFINYIDKSSHNFNTIITTNNYHALDEVLVSRFFRINLPKYESSKLVDKINHISKLENITFTTESINHILKISDNSLQFIINLIEKCKLISDNVDLNILMKCSTLINFKNFEDYLEKTISKDINNSYLILLKFIDNGYSVLDIMNEFYKFIKYTNLLKDEIKFKIFKNISNYIVIFSTIHEENIELYFFTHDLVRIFT